MSADKKPADIVPLFRDSGVDSATLERYVRDGNKNPLEVLLAVMDMVREERGAQETHIACLEREKADFERRVALLLEKVADLQLDVENYRDQSMLDPLTNIGNRRAFQERLTNEFSRAQRYQEWVSLLYVDLDHFKRINDQYGHPAGDAVLVETAGRIKDSLRASDFVGRVGGEEFVVIAPYSDEQKGLVLGEKIQTAIAGKKIAAKGIESLAVTASVGVAAYSPVLNGAVTLEEMTQRADQALYQAKQEGRNRVVAYGAVRRHH